MNRWKCYYSISRIHVTCLQAMFFKREYYCKYYRIDVSYCIHKNWYLPLYRKIKSLLYIQLMTGVRGLAWKKRPQCPHTHTTGRTLNGTCPGNTRSHSLALDRMHNCHTRTSLSLRIFLCRTAKYNTAQITSWKGILERGSLVLHYPEFSISFAKNISDWKVVLGY